MRQEFTYNQIAHLNAALHEQRLPYRISFHDAETAVVEPLGFCACDGKEGMLKAAIEAFFENSTLPYEVDVIDLNNITDKFKQHIINDLVEI